ncbi:putative ribonuclease H-like domain-containing protein [Tanacetum coccineum]
MELIPSPNIIIKEVSNGIGHERGGPNGFKPRTGLSNPIDLFNALAFTNTCLGKFDGKSDEGFFVGYSFSSKAFRVEDSLNNENAKQDKFEDDSSTKDVNAAGQHVNTASPDVNTGSLKLNVVGHHDEDEPEVDLGNITNSYIVPTTPNTRIHKDHPIDNVIGEVKSTVQTRRMTKPTSEQGFLSDVYEQKTHDTLNTCLYACFLSKFEPTCHLLKLFLIHPGWKGSKQEGTLQFNFNWFWIIVICLVEWRAVGYKRVLRNKKMNRALWIRNKQGIKIFFRPMLLFMDFLVYQMDVKSAFLYGTIEEEVYVTQPLEFKDPDHLDKVYKVVKALYGLHQAPRASSLLHDILFGYINMELVQQKEDGIFISQDKYVAEILKKFNYSDVKSASTPVDLEKPLVKDGDADDVDVHLYRSMIGSLMYLTASRPDIMFAVCACARFQVTPKTSHLLAVKRIFRYLKGKPTLGLWYSRDSPFELVAYTDSDYAGATQDRKSTTGGCQFLGNRLISWQCKKQTVVATSTTEAEYVAAASCCGQVLWIQNQLLDYGYNFMNTVINIDNNNLLTKGFDAGRFQYLVSSSGLRCQDTILGDVNAQTRFEITSKQYNDPPLSRGYTLGSEEDTMKLIGIDGIFPKFAETHNVVAFLEKPEESDGFAEIIDFLKASSVHYALTVNPVIYTSCIEQFWATAKVQTVNGVRQLQALVDKKRVIVTESSIRRDLHLDDAEGTDCLPTATIFEELARMGYEKPSQKLTFYKAFFSPQWKYFIHTITQCLSAKSTAWNEFSSSMASLIICLATNQKFNLSKYIFDAMVKHLDGGVKFLMYPRFLQVFINHQLGNMSTHKKIFVNPFHTKKVFANMKRARKDFSGRITPLFDTMMVQATEEVGEDSDHQTDSTQTPIIDQPSSSSQPKKKQPSKKAQRQEAEVPQDETEHEESVLYLQKVKDAQAQEIATLKKRIQRLERKKLSRPTGLKRPRKVGMSRRVESFEDQESLGALEDASKQGRSIADIVADVDVSLVDETQKRQDDDLMFDTGVLEDDEMPIEAKVDRKDEQSTKPDDSTAGEVVTTASVEVSVVSTTTEEITLAQTLIQIKAAKPKVVTTVSTTITTTRPKDRGVVVQEPIPLKRKDQIALDEQIARDIQAKLDAELIEEQKLARKREEEANIALIESWENTQAMMEADRLLAERR